MIPKTRSFRDLRNPIGVVILLAAFAAAAGCSNSNTTGDVVVNHVDASGNSVSGWVTPTGGSHASSATMNYIANGGTSSCTECHGSDLAGGISRVSCFGNTAGCHHGPVPNWATAAVHGATAKKAPGSSGFASCQICHGKNFSGGGAISCFTCHAVSAPHSPKPWLGSTSTHTTTAAANAPVCYQCHAYSGTANPNNPHVPPTPASAGTAPGCFNGTMCHNQAGHPAGWVATSPAAQPHGVSAKATPAAAAGFAYCQTCHGTGTNFSGGTSGVSCYTCHVPTANSPHASQWRTGDTYVHTTTDAGNAAVCAYCHLNGANSPIAPPSPPAPAGTAAGCFNSTLCHGQAGHPAGWVATSPAAQPHGVSAKATPAAAAGFAYCQTCHGTGTNFSGGTSGVSCYTCHVPTANSPHASQWRTGDTYVHTTTDAGNAAVCAYCHLNGANSPIAPPSPPAPAGTAAGCFNSTLCHGSGGVAHPVPYNNGSHYTVTSGTFPGSCSTCHDVSAPSTKAGPVCQTCHVAASPLAAANCTSCHASPPNGGAPAGAAYANIAGAHGVHIALASTGTPISCDTCHNGLGTNTLTHYNAAKSRVSPGDAAFLATYNAQSGASSFNSAGLSCSNVSCHGGQGTPNWQTGAINPNTQCASCHAFNVAQYNSYRSGQHDSGGHNGETCTACHNITTLAVNHFTTLGTTAMEGPASATIGGTGTSIPAGGYNPATGSCSPSCHGTETW